MAKDVKVDFKIKAAHYNPRKLSKASESKLKLSMQEFGDISGITINKKTGNIFAGNHRWKQLEETYGTLELKHIEDDRFGIYKKGSKYVGYVARIVDWSLTKEKQANIVANLASVAGDFTEQLQAELQEIKADSDIELMRNLGLNEIILDNDLDDDDLDMDETRTDTKRRKTVEDLIEDDKKPSPVKEIISTLKITSPSEYKEEIMETVLKALSKKEFYDEITVS